MRECTEGGVALCIHATSFFKVVCANVHTNCLIKGYESLHLGIIFNRVEDDIVGGNLIVGSTIDLSISTSKRSFFSNYISNSFSIRIFS
jgi:hypothetical protein